ncbi:hypothetical protein MXB_3077 [Myxobolus squamalis]|nr:hypothetical protein MXB_3077 [Myxobolus squamalis]
MRRPEEVIIYVNEHGEVVRQFMRDTDSINLYVACKDTLSNLTYLNPEEMKSIIFERLDSEMSAPIFCWNRLNSIGWAVGSISGSMTVDMERDFLVRVLKNLLALCDEKKGKENKAIIASNIMYVVQQYPRFLKPHYRFLKTLAKVQQDEHRSFVEEVTSVLPETLSLLNLHQLETVYEALGQIISVHDDAPKAQRLILACLNEQINQWSFFMSQFISNPALANDIESIQKLSCFLRVCTAMCRSVGGGQDTEDLFLDEVRKEMSDVKDRQAFKSKYDLQESKYLHDYHTIS